MNKIILFEDDDHRESVEIFKHVDDEATWLCFIDEEQGPDGQWSISAKFTLTEHAIRGAYKLLETDND